MTGRFDRRRFVQLASTVTAGALVLGGNSRSGLSLFVSADAADAKPVVIKPAVGGLYRVRMEISVDGNINIPKDPLLSKKLERSLPLTAKSVIDFEERLTRDSNEKPAAGRRYYYTAESDVKLGDASQSKELRKEAKRVIAHLGEGPAVLYGEKEFLTHDELELLQDPICSLGIDGLLPTSAVKPGDKWEPSSESLATVLNLDGVVKSTVEGQVLEIDAASVKMLLKGSVNAAIQGVPSVIDLAGKMTFDQKSKSVTWLAIAIREKREIGLAKPGFEVSATVKLIRQALDSPNAVRDTTPIDISKPVPPEKLLVQFKNDEGNFSMFLDRDWQTLNSTKGLSTLRMVVNDAAIAQCDVRELPKMKPGEQLTIEAFQAEIEKSLGDKFSEFLESEVGLNGTGLRTLRTVAAGVVQELPVQWVFLHFSDDYGRRVAATFTVEAKNVEAFGGADAQLANSFEFTKPEPPKQAAAPKSVLER